MCKSLYIFKFKSYYLFRIEPTNIAIKVVDFDQKIKIDHVNSCKQRGHTRVGVMESRRLFF